MHGVICRAQSETIPNSIDQDAALAPIPECRQPEFECFWFFFLGMGYGVGYCGLATVSDISWQKSHASRPLKIPGHEFIQNDTW